MTLTDEELLTQIVSDFEDLLVTKYPKITLGHFIALSTDKLSVYSGNRCPLCTRDAINNWIRDNNIKHSDEIKDEIKH